MLKCNPKELHGKEIFQNPLGAIRHLWVSFYVTKELFKCYVSLDKQKSSDTRKNAKKV